MSLILCNTKAILKHVAARLRIDKSPARFPSTCFSSLKNNITCEFGKYGDLGNIQNSRNCKFGKFSVSLASFVISESFGEFGKCRVDQHFSTFWNSRSLKPKKHHKNLTFAYPLLTAHVRIPLVENHWADHFMHKICVFVDKMP